MRRAAIIAGAVLLLAGMGALATTVVSTHAVLGEFARIIGGEAIDVVTIIPSGFCPALYDLTPSDLASVLGASVVLYSGFEPWIQTLADAVGSDAAVVQLPGEWNTPEAAAEQVRTIRDLLASQFPESSEDIRVRADAYVEELLALGDTLKERAEAAEVSDVSVLCMQWQADFVSWLGYHVAGTYGVPANLSLRDLVALAAVGNDAGAQLVIDNLQSGVDFGAKLAREVDAVHVVLSNFPGAMPGTATVIDLLTRNAEALLSALEPLG